MAASPVEGTIHFTSCWFCSRPRDSAACLPRTRKRDFLTEKSRTGKKSVSCSDQRLILFLGNFGRSRSLTAEAEAEARTSWWGSSGHGFTLPGLFSMHRRWLLLVGTKSFTLGMCSVFPSPLLLRPTQSASGPLSLTPLPLLSLSLTLLLSLSFWAQYCDWAAQSQPS